MNFKMLLICLLAVGCQQGDKPKAPEHGNKPAEQPVPLAGYVRFVESLDTNVVQNVAVAAREFKNQFATATTSQADSGFVIFENFYAKVANSLNEQNVEHPADSTIQKNNSVLLLQNGFQYDTTEGTLYLKRNRQALSSYFEGLLSTTMQKYLAAVDQENEEGFVEDGKLLITPEQLSRRILFWEDFTRNDPSFPFNRELQHQQKEYTTFLLEGVEKMPVVTKNEAGKNYTKAYQYVLDVAAQSNLATLIRPYYKALQAHDFAAAENILQNYRSQGLILDFSA